MTVTRFVLAGPIRRRRLLAFGSAAVVLGLAAGCGGSAATVPTAAGQQPTATGTPSANLLRPATLMPGQRIPLPKGKSVLTVTGRVGAPNKDAAVVLDLSTLNTLGLVRVRLYEPWAKQTLEFRGVWLMDLLKVAAVPADATRVHLTALDDYQVDLTVPDVRSGGILLATQTGDGAPIPIDKGGPTRILYLDGKQAGANPDQWIWSLKTIDVQ